MTEFVLSNTDMHPAEEIAHLKDLLGKANTLARIRAERIKELEAQAGAEPVAWMFQNEETGLTECVDVQQVEWGFEKNNPRWQKICPLYASPPARVPLTDEEIEDVWNFLVAKYIEDVDHAYWSRCDFEFARAIEAAHGITK